MASAFDWRSDKRPSIFASDPRFVPYASGKSRSQTATETVVATTKKTGRSPGTITGISREEQKRRAKAHAKRSGAQ